jgi:glycine dehydrogenase subunit 2
MSEPLIFEYESVARQGFFPEAAGESKLPDAVLRKDELIMPRASELEVVRHFTRLSQLNFSIDTHF